MLREIIDSLRQPDEFTARAAAWQEMFRIPLLETDSGHVSPRRIVPNLG